MAICYARLEFIKRSSGKNMVAKSAYNGKCRLNFEGNCIFDAHVYDWSGKSEAPMYHGIHLPKHVDEKFRDPEKLWNYAEKFERRRDSQVGKELVLALPDDKAISDEQRIEMVISFVEKNFVLKGYGVQINVHQPSIHESYDEQEGKITKNEKNTHAHVLITARSFSEDGKSFSNKKMNELNPEIRGGNHFAFGGIEWHKLWTQFQNEYFEEKGIDLRVDQKGVLPQIHLGPVRMRSKVAYEILDLQDKRLELGKQIAVNSNVIAEKLTENKSVFAASDLEIFLQKNVSEEETSIVRESFWKNPRLVQLYDRENQQATQKFSTIEVVEEERRIMRLAERIQKKSCYQTRISDSSSTLNNEQRYAFEKITNGNLLSCIEGLAGTGKSHLLKALKDHYESNGFRVRAFGPDNATVKVLQEKGFSVVSNVHSFLFRNYFSKQNAIEYGKEVWIIDESSKLGNKPLLELLKLAQKNNIQLIFSGNSAQLSSVDRGGLFKCFCDQFGYAYLGEVQRQNSAMHRDIAKQLAHGNVSAAVNMIANTGGFAWSNSREENFLKVIEKWAVDKVNFPYATSLIIAHTNSEVRQINDLVHTFRMANGEISKNEFNCSTIFGAIRVSAGDLIEFRANSKEMKITNGQQGVLVKVSEDKFEVALENGSVCFDPKKYNSFQLAYASTFFRSQGRTIDRTYIVYHHQMHQKLLYVGMTRHVRNVHCFVSRTEASCLMDIKRQTARKNEAENTLNYLTRSEIENIQKSQEREKAIQEFCNSNSLLSRAQGYGSKLFDSLKSGFHSIVEQTQDVKSNRKFYNIPEQTQHTGCVVEVKEETLTPSSFIKSLDTSVDKAQQKEENKRVVPVRNSSFSKLSDENKSLYRAYFEKSEKASSLYTVVQSEVEASSIVKESAASFDVWQKACIERNQAAFDLLRKGVQHEAILGKKGADILQDRARRYEHLIEPKDSVESRLSENIDLLLHRLFPEGPQRRDSRGFRFGSNGSLQVTCIGDKKGLYYNFENKEGGNLLSLIKRKLDLSHDAARSWAQQFLQESEGKSAPSHFSTEKFVKRREESWISLTPAPNVAPPELRALSRYLDTNYRLAALYPYYDKGELVFYTARLESKENGKKIVLPISYGKSHSESEPTWGFKGHALRREVLYNSTLIHQHPEKPILIVEGEKTADSAQKLLGKDYNVVTWSGGASAAKEVNWQALANRDVVIWPDNDSPGFRAAADIGVCLRRVGIKSLKIISNETLKELPLKWDLADALPTGKPLSFIENCLLRAETKAIGMDQLEALAAQYRMTFKQFNEVVCGIDERLRSELEAKYGAKTWEIDAAILSEANKQLNGQHRSFVGVTNGLERKGYEKEFGKSMTQERN